MFRDVALSLFHYPSDKGFGYALGINVVLDAMRRLGGRMLGESDVRSGGYEQREFFMKFASLGQHGSWQKGRGGYTPKRADMCVASDGRTGGRLCSVYIYSCLCR